jgi:hypothetical protein
MITELPTWMGGVLKAVGVATILGAGTTVIATSQRVAVHEVQLQSLDKLTTRIETLNDKLDTTNSKLDRMIGEETRHGK